MCMYNFEIYIYIVKRGLWKNVFVLFLLPRCVRDLYVCKKNSGVYDICTVCFKLKGYRVLTESAGVSNSQHTYTYIHTSTVYLCRYCLYIWSLPLDKGSLFLTPKSLEGNSWLLHCSNILVLTRCVRSVAIFVWVEWPLYRQQRFPTVYTPQCTPHSVHPTVYSAGWNGISEPILSAVVSIGVTVRRPGGWCTLTCENLDWVAAFFWYLSQHCMYENSGGNPVPKSPSQASLKPFNRPSIFCWQCFTP